MGCPITWYSVFTVLAGKAMWLEVYDTRVGQSLKAERGGPRFWENQKLDHFICTQ